MSEDQGTYNIETLRRESAVLRKYAAIQKAAEDKIGCQKIYIDMTGDLAAAFVLDEIIFFTLPKGHGKSALRVWKEGSLWMAVQRAEWWERKRLTPRQADSAIDKLEALGLIIKKVFKFNGQTTIHLRLIVSKFFECYVAELEKNNPPENQEDTITKDIGDLYEMMGVNRELQNGDSRIGETESPFGETELQNGDSINIPHQPSHNLNAAAPPLSDKPKKDAVDFEIDFHLKPGGIRNAIAQHFKLTPNWDAKYNRQFLEWTIEAGMTVEQIERAANVWKMDRRFNWTVPTLKGIQEHWQELIYLPEIESQRHNPIPERIRTPRPAHIPPPRIGGNHD